MLVNPPHKEETLSWGKSSRPGPGWPPCLNGDNFKMLDTIKTSKITKEDDMRPYVWSLFEYISKWCLSIWPLQPAQCKMYKTTNMQYLSACKWWLFKVSKMTSFMFWFVLSQTDVSDFKYLMSLNDTLSQSQEIIPISDILIRPRVNHYHSW